MEEKNKLAENIQELTRQIESSNSLWKSLWRGILFGIGTVIGASIIAAIALGMLAKITNSLKDVPGFFK